VTTNSKQQVLGVRRDITAFSVDFIGCVGCHGDTGGGWVISDLNVTSASLTVAVNPTATAIAIAEPTDSTNADSALTMTVDELPTDGGGLAG
jgi:hypothetical protein